jgi:hypothetical protein
MELFQPAPPIKIEPPHCPTCGMSMILTAVLPDTPDHEQRMFECRLCHDALSEVVKYK